MRSGDAGSFPIICLFAASKRTASMDFSIPSNPYVQYQYNMFLLSRTHFCKAVPSQNRKLERA